MPIKIVIKRRRQGCLFLENYFQKVFELADGLGESFEYNLHLESVINEDSFRPFLLKILPFLLELSAIQIK